MCLPLLAFGLALAPDHLLDRRSAAAVASFGARSIFCNRLPLINAALNKDPSLHIAGRESEVSLRAVMRALLESDREPWRVMGFDGDHCMYDAGLQRLVAEHFPDADAQKAFYLGAYATALRSDPLPFIGMFLRQIVLGVEKTFDMFAIHTPFFPATSELSARWPLFLVGTSTVDAGPLNSAARTRQTPVGWIVNGLLGVFFWTLQIVYFAIFAATLILPFARWSTWDGRRRNAFAVYVALPFLIILAHHAVVGVSHSFDIRRYGFNLFFVNVAFLAAGCLFWLAEAMTIRKERRLRSGAT